jgi:hypothetical protein
MSLTPVVQSDLLKQHLGQMRLRQRRGFELSTENSMVSPLTTRSMTDW